MCDLIAMAIINPDLPFSFVEYRKVMELLKFINTEAKNYFRCRVTLDVINKCQSERNKLK